MATNVRLTRGRGGNRHPIAVKEFIVERLGQVGEDCISGMHQAYKDALIQLARDRKREFLYHHATYHSFYQQVWELTQEGKIELSGREEPSDSPGFAGRENKPTRKYYRLARSQRR